MQKYPGDRLVTTSISPGNSDLVAYSSTFSSGEEATIVVNTATTSRTALININHFRHGSKYYWYALKPCTDNGEFSGKVNVNAANTAGTVGGPLSDNSINPFSADLSSQSIKIAIPARTTIYLAAERKR